MKMLEFSQLVKHKLVLGWLLFLVSSNCFSKQQYLQLNDVLRSVSRCYPQIKIARLEIIKAQGSYQNALGKFDPSLKVNTLSQPFGGYINNYEDVQFDVPTFYNGVKLFSGYRIGQGDWPIYYQNYLTNSEGEYRAGLSLPLLQGRTIDKQRATLFTKAETIHMKQEGALNTEIQIYQESIKAYWRWVEAGLQLKLFKDLLKLAEKRQKAIVRQENQGDLPRIAVVENLQQIMRRKQLLNQGSMIFQKAAIDLSLYYRDRNGNPQQLNETELPPYLLERTTELAKSIRELADHPALRELDSYSKTLHLKEILAKNQLLPNLDLTAYTFKQNGTGGYPLLLEQGAMIGINFKFSLFQREAKGNLIAIHSELGQVTVQKKLLYEKLKIQLMKLFNGIKFTHQQVLLLTTELDLARQLEVAERKKFQAGDSTLFLVNQREQSTTQARLDLLNAKVKLEEMKDLVRFFSSTQPNLA